MARFEFPDGKRFAFTIIDDTDGATVENVAPIYRLLENLGIRTTKTVWPLACPEGSRNFFASQTLEDRDYLAFVCDLQRRGFEITWHGATMESSRRERTLAGLERFRELIGHYPRVHANHSENRENIYWGTARIDQPLLKFVLGYAAWPADYYVGHKEESPYYWGDVCSRHITYARNLTFKQLNLASINPSMPYWDPARPFVRFWFSASDAEDAEEFIELLSPEQQDCLDSEGGFCIVATHFAKGYVKGSSVHPLVQARLEAMARRRGWFPTTGELLDWLCARRDSEHLPDREWRRMQWRWARDLAARKWRQFRN